MEESWSGPGIQLFLEIMVWWVNRDANLIIVRIVIRIERSIDGFTALLEAWLASKLYGYPTQNHSCYCYQCTCHCSH
ncbi:hypothetical protein OIU78_024872 [Salix suchowensis]|nr:hypothetical protein OIU78_024872 [Salix suchowensis]